MITAEQKLERLRQAWIEQNKLLIEQELDDLASELFDDEQTHYNLETFKQAD